MATARRAVDRVAAAQPSVAELDDYELGEDVWDVRLFPGARYDPHRSNYALNFVPIPAPFRTIVKRYIKLRLATWSYASCRQHLQFLPRFLSFFVTCYPGIQHFRDLTVDDIDAYLQYLQSTGTTTGKPLSSSYRSLAISTLELFLRYLQRIDSSLAPTRPLDKLIWPEHRPLYQRRAANGIRYIPEMVLAQLDAHIHKLRARYIPVIIILRASGWRISDVLQLRYDSCLECTERGWYLVGDIHKTQVLGHKVPITEEVAAVIQAQVAVAKQRLADRLDVHRYLFPAYSQRRREQPLEVGTIMRALNRLAVTCEIRDERGVLFHFRSHAFRHTKAVELINNGMPLTYVQQWLAHASPEMTLVYAKLLDTTMRDKWEQAMAQGAVRITSTGQPYAVDPATLDSGNELELAHVRAHLDARRLQNGYCFKPQKFDCPAAHIPCYSCAMFVTTPAFLAQFEHEQRETIELIQIGEAAGRTHWVEANHRKLEKLERIIATLDAGRVHQPLGKAKREYQPGEGDIPLARGKEDEHAH